MPEDDERSGPATWSRGPSPRGGAGSLPPPPVGPVVAAPTSLPPGGVPYQAAPPNVEPTTNGLAVAALALGLAWLFWLGSVLAVILGHLALRQIERSRGWERGRGLAIAALLLGYLWLALLVFSIVASATTSR